MICVRCGQQLGESTKGMEVHMRRYHQTAVVDRPKFPPKEVTVAKWEFEHPEFFVGLGPECHEGCKCNRCFHKALDLLVAQSEAKANDLGNDLSINDVVASDELQKRSSTDRQYTIQHGYGSENE